MALRFFVRVIPLAIAVALFSGCAAILTPIPPAQYNTLNGKRFVRVTAKDGKWHESGELAVKDFTLTIVKPREGLDNPRLYPMSFKFDEIESVSTVRSESLVYIESGVEHGGSNQGAASQFYSETFLVIDVGYLSGERKRLEHSRWGFGGTLMTAVSDMDFRMGAKARVRYRMNRHFSFDATAGPMLTSWNDGLFNGFVGGVNLNAGSFFTIRSEYMAYDVPPWREANYYYPGGYTYIQHPGGYEQVWYNGVAFRGTMGWVTASVGTVAMFAILVASLSALGGSN